MQVLSTSNNVGCDDGSFCTEQQQCDASGVHRSATPRHCDIGTVPDCATAACDGDRASCVVSNHYGGNTRGQDPVRSSSHDMYPLEGDMLAMVVGAMRGCCSDVLMKHAPQVHARLVQGIHYMETGVMPTSTTAAHPDQDLGLLLIEASKSTDVEKCTSLVQELAPPGDQAALQLSVDSSKSESCQTSVSTQELGVEGLEDDSVPYACTSAGTLNDTSAARVSDVADIVPITASSQSQVALFPRLTPCDGIECIAYDSQALCLADIGHNGGANGNVGLTNTSNASLADGPLAAEGDVLLAPEDVAPSDGAHQSETVDEDLVDEAGSSGSATNSTVHPGGEMIGNDQVIGEEDVEGAWGIVGEVAHGVDNGGVVNTERPAVAARTAGCKGVPNSSKYAQRYKGKKVCLKSLHC